jgi:hypothetical protein
MSGLETGENKWKGKLEKMNKNAFFSFARPYFDLIGKGKIFSLVYFVMAAVNLVFPFMVIYGTIESGIFNYGAKFVFAIILSWLVIFFAGWIGFQLWWNRRTKITDIAASEFIATPIFSEIIQTFGEWLGTMIGIIWAGVGLLASIFLGSDMSYLFSAIGLNFLSFGAAGIIIGPIIGFFIIIIFRFIAEQLRLFASLVNNTKEIAANLKK